MKMKTISRSAILLFLLCAAVPLLAQERVIEKNEFDSIYQTSLVFLRTRAYRSTTEIKRDGDDSPVNRTSVYEFVPPDRYHSFLTWTDAIGNNKKNESIKIGTESWFRENDGPWKVSGNGYGTGSGSGSGSGSGRREIEQITEYKMTAGVKIGGEFADLYQFSHIVKYEDPAGRFETTIARNNWINKQGLLLKSEYTSADPRLNINYITSTVYEYDPRIKIDPPAVVPETKSN
jgi:hypothetical protein